MRWHVKTRPPLSEWHRWWAWHPVKISDNNKAANKWVWLEAVERKLIHTYGDCYMVYRIAEFIRG